MAMTIVQTRPGSEGILAWPLRSAACAILSLTDLAGALSRGGRERDRVVVTLRDAGRIGVVPSYSGGEGRTVLWLTALVTVVSSGVSDALAYAAGCGMLGLTAFAWRRRMPVSSGFGVFFLVDFGLGVKRHSKLTPWRHRKLTPEETAYAPEVERGDVPSVS